MKNRKNQQLLLEVQKLKGKYHSHFREFQNTEVRFENIEIVLGGVDSFI